MKAVLFDLDGVLIDSYRVWHAVINAFARNRGFPEISDELMARGWGQGVDADAAMFFPGSDEVELEAFYDSHFLDHLDALEITPDAAAVLDRLRSLGCRTAIVTNTPHQLAQRLVDRAPFSADEITGTTERLRPKPASDMLIHACELLGVSLSEAVMVGDSAFDRDAASAAGVPFLAYGWDGGRRIEELADVVEMVLEQEGRRRPRRPRRPRRS